jgi:hypothetical protein
MDTEQPRYTDITRIVELHDLVEVNDHLARGWRLLSVRTGGSSDTQQTIYILGRVRAQLAVGIHAHLLHRWLSPA